jgi:uncharacterized protein
LDAEFCIVGLGPAGLGAALSLSHKELICVEAGVAAEERFCTILQHRACRRAEPCQITGGVGGSAILSGGKISTFPAGTAMEKPAGKNLQRNLDDALEKFAHYVPLIAPDESKEIIESQKLYFEERGFAFRYYPAYRYRHADIVNGCRTMLREIESAGGTIRLQTEIKSICRAENGNYRIFARSKQGDAEFVVRKVVIACGRSGVELMKTVSRELNLREQHQRCDVGVRLEFASSLWPHIDEAHKDLKLHFGNARTFCVCKEGSLAPYRVGDIFLVEGHSDPDDRTGYTNFAITIRLAETEPNADAVFEAIRMRLSALSSGRPIRQLLADYLANRDSVIVPADSPSSISFWRWGNANACLPEPQCSQLRNAVRHFAERLLPVSAHAQISVYAPELDYYWPRFQIRSGFASASPGVFLVGDACGHFRGILQAFCSGVLCGLKA